MQEVVVEDKGVSDKIALVDVQGMISGEATAWIRHNQGQRYKAQLKLAAAGPRRLKRSCSGWIPPAEKSWLR